MLEKVVLLIKQADIILLYILHRIMHLLSV